MPTQELSAVFKEDLSARLQAMRSQECTNYTCPDYLAPEWQASLASGSQSELVLPGNASAAARGGESSASSSEINEMWREKICEWCYQVVDHFDFNREIVSVAMSYLDRYLSTRSVNRRMFQLAAMTALYLAIKLYEPGKIRMSSLIDLSRGYFLEDHIVTMEDSMLQTLGWHVHPPTPYSFVREMIYMLPVQTTPRDRHDTNELARFLTELSVCDYWFVTKKPSSIALASLLNALELQGEPKIPRHYKIELLQQLGGCGSDISIYDEEVITCYERLREMYIAGGYSPVTSIPEPEPSRIATVSPTGPIEQMDVEAATAASGSCE
jgi:lipoyl(octanoyl) transferase